MWTLFLAKYKNGGVLKLGYQSVSPRYDPDYYRVYYARGRSERDVRNAGEGAESAHATQRSARKSSRFLGAHALPAEHHTGKHLRRSARGHAEPENSPHLLQARFIFSVRGASAPKRKDAERNKKQ